MGIVVEVTGKQGRRIFERERETEKRFTMLFGGNIDIYMFWKW